MGNTAIFWLIILGLFWLGLFVIPAYRLKNAILQVIRIFKSQGTFCSSSTNAKTSEELGITPPGGMRIISLRDFKPYAIQVLVKAGIIQLFEDGKMCLQERKAAEFLAANRLEE